MVEAYLSGRCGTYEECAAMFGVGEATVSRNLRRKRETGDVLYKASGHRGRSIDRDWLVAHAHKHPDARCQDRADAWAEHSGIRVTPQAISRALREVGWSFKKRPQSRGSGTRKPTS